MYLYINIYLCNDVCVCVYIYVAMSLFISTKFPFRDLKTDGPNGHWYQNQAEVDHTHDGFCVHINWCFNGEGDPKNNCCWNGLGNPWLPTTILGLIKFYFGPPRPSECTVCSCFSLLTVALLIMMHATIPPTPTPIYILLRAHSYHGAPQTQNAPGEAA
jgi:hypothetical protein